jgi:uncharacterized protein (DUF2236 family)
VAEHSRYRGDRIGRLLGTLRPMYAIAFGSPAQVRQAAAGVNAMHARVSGAGYSARDPALLAWVLATLIDSALLVHHRFVRPLCAEETQHYYDDMRALGALLGVPASALPATATDFGSYVHDTLASLEVCDAARAIADDLFRPLPGSGPAMPLVRELTAGLLPPRLRRQFGLTWDPGRAAVLQAAATLSRQLLPLLPASLRRPPWFVMPPAA